MPLKDEIKNIISGTGFVTKGNIIHAVANHIRKSKKASTVPKEKELVKEQEAERILAFARRHEFLLPTINRDRYLAEGAEQKVYFEPDGRHVIKLNDSIFYETWEDYFNSLLLHNYFFPETSYELTGFYHENNKLYAVVKQVYVFANEATDESAINKFMTANGFQSKRNNDYFSKELGIILEDLHDENVLTSNAVLFFIDTVFYLTSDFYNG